VQQPALAARTTLGVDVFFLEHSVQPGVLQNACSFSLYVSLSASKEFCDVYMHSAC